MDFRVKNSAGLLTRNSLPEKQRFSHFKQGPESKNMAKHVFFWGGSGLSLVFDTKPPPKNLFLSYVYSPGYVKKCVNHCFSGRDLRVNIVCILMHFVSIL